MTAKRTDLTGLPSWPGMMSREQAAAYCALSPSAFDTYIRPVIQEKHYGAAVRFSRTDLDKHIDTTQGNGEGSDPTKALEAL